jgi:hypothetical protein
MAGIASLEAAESKLSRAHNLLREASQNLIEATQPPGYLRGTNAIDTYNRRMVTAYTSCVEASAKCAQSEDRVAAAIEELERFRGGR